MRSVVVVLPASIWAMIPMLRVFSSEYCRSTSASLPPYDSLHEKRGVRLRPPLHFDLSLPAIMRERLVGLRHLVRVFSLLYSGAAVARGVEELAGELLGHAALAPTAGGADDPPHRQRGAPVGTHFDRHLIRRPSDPPRLDLDHGLHAVDRGLEHLERVLLAPILDRHQGLVHDLLGRRLLAADHHDVHELRHEPAPVLRIRQHFTLGRSRPSHGLTRCALRCLGAVLGAALLTARHPGGVERTPDDVVANPREILDAAGPDHDDRVLLEVVADAWDIRRHLEPVRQPHPRDLAERRVRLLGRRRVDADADAALLGTPLHRGRLRLLTHRLTTLMDQLGDGRHDSPSPSRRQNSHFITLRPCGVNDLGRTIYPATATDSSASPSGTGGGVSDSTLSSDFTASPPGVSTSTRV